MPCSDLKGGVDAIQSNLGGGIFDIYPESFGQYTGMKDKHGRKIFEGDIVDCWSEGVNAQGTVQQRKDGLWIIYPAWQKHIMWGLCPDEYSNTTVEIIGNVFENADLLEG
jgi:uncharacterized phage protein (TIGR01671 family)